ncbi:MFS transporter [Pontibacter anaerobius]|uniref:MFS transporter n=1 Tax=Pontibacter anaerobius TaxID=2993940 RepID=A0ABT3RGJ8_9BACT|nr:MFS transporter [Pontibacter anaerobius]MCX2740742.1 MFS transporter [Pontibacter anaerobius]
MTKTNTRPAAPQLTRSTLWLMTIAAGMVVANNYYNQPLLVKIADTFQVPEAQAGIVAMLSQVGYAIGLLFIIPLGDMLRRKRLILIDFVLIILSLLLAAYAPNIYTLMAASLLIGATCVVPQLFVPMAAHLAKPEERGKAVGTVMSGLLVGILFSRTLSGFVGEHLGWRAMFLIAAGLMLVLWVALYFLLPEIHPEFKGNYKSLMKSLLHLFRTEPVLRLASARGALSFACFGGFWTTLVFLLEGPPFFKGSDVAGAFGLVGAGGAIMASVMGRLSDRFDTRYIQMATLVMIILAYVVFGSFSYSILMLVVGVILLDLGLQGSHISNQTLIFSLDPAARNRLNTVYMFTYFMGGATGTILATQAWQLWRWSGVVLVGLFFSSLALAVHLLFSGKVRKAL